MTTYLYNICTHMYFTQGIKPAQIFIVDIKTSFTIHVMYRKTLLVTSHPRKAVHLNLSLLQTLICQDMFNQGNLYVLQALYIP